MQYKRKKQHRANALKKKFSTSRRTKNLDEVDNDLKDQSNLLNQEVDVDKPGLGQHYCIHCARYFIDRKTLIKHFTMKEHKRRLKDLELEPYTIEESERAAGKGNFILPKRRKIETQPYEKLSSDNTSIQE